MKTSNKLILSLLIFSFLGSLGTLFAFKNNMVVVKYDNITQKNTEGNGVLKTKVILDTFQSEIIYINRNQVVTLDPEANNVTATWDENLLERLSISEKDNSFYISDNHYNHDPVTYNLAVTIGVKDRKNLKIYCDDNGQLRNEGVVKTDVLIIDNEDNSLVNLTVETSVLDIRSENNAMLTLKGSAETVHMQGEESSQSDFSDLNMNTMTVVLYNNSKLTADRCNTVVGKLRNNSSLDFVSKIPPGMIDARNDSSYQVVN